MDELMNLLSQLGLGAASDPIYDMIMDLDTESLSPSQLEQAIRSVLTLHGCEACADPMIAALGEIGFYGLQPRARRDGDSHGGEDQDGKDKAAGDEGADLGALRFRVTAK